MSVLIKNKKILFVITGSIATYKVATVLSQLKKKNYEIKVVATSAALKFIGLSTLEGLTSEKIYTELYTTGSNMDHIHLIRWADIIVIAPATANFINKLASGVADDLASTLFLAHDFKKPCLIFPAMNTKMFLHPATQNSIKKISDWGITILDSESGALACGETGVGRLLEPEEILNKIDQALKIKDESKSLPKNIIQGLKKIKILISAGGTQEPIDDVRVITNKSTGQTGANLADFFIELGFDVTFLHSENSKKPLLSCEMISFTTYNDLEKKLSICLQNKMTHFFHLAAVSDYSVKPFHGKINSESESLTLHLTKNKKLIDQVKKMNSEIKLIGFKLTSSEDVKYIETKVKNLFQSSHSDLVIQNDWHQKENGQHTFNIYSNTENTLRLISKNLNFENLSIELFNYMTKDSL